MNEGGKNNVDDVGEIKLSRANDYFQPEFWLKSNFARLHLTKTILNV